MKGNKKLNKQSPLRFAVIFIVLFLLFYYFNICFFGITQPGNYYSTFLANNLNYIQLLRHFLLNSSAQILTWMGFITITNDTELLLVGHGTLRLVYTCLGLGVMSFFSAFVIAYPGAWHLKLVFILVGFIVIQLLNILRFILLALFWQRQTGQIIDHHLIFNIIIYIIVAVSLYFWVKYIDKKSNATH